MKPDNKNLKKEVESKMGWWIEELAISQKKSYRKKIELSFMA